MLDQRQLMEYMDGCRGELSPSEIRALFLIGIEADEDNTLPIPSCDEIAERVSDVMAKTFYKSDVVAHWTTRCKKNATRLAVFLSGPLTERVIWRKARTLRVALLLALEDFTQAELSCNVGVYISQDATEGAEQLLRRGKEALHLAAQEEVGGCYVCSSYEALCREEQDVREKSDQPVRDSRYESEEWVRFLSQQTDSQLWEVNLKTRVFRLFQEKDLVDGRSYIYENFPESLIENGKIHQRSAEAFRGFAESMLSGHEDARGNFIVQYRQNLCYGWASLTYHVLRDESGHPYKALGRTEMISPLPDTRAEYALRRPMPPSLYSRLFCYLQANLTHNSVERVRFEGREQTTIARCWSFDDALHHGIRRMFNREDAQRFRERFSREHLLEQFEQGRRWSLDRCRMVDFSGKVQWVSVGVNLARNPDTDEVYLFAYMCQMNGRQELEALCRAPVNLDSRTGLYEEVTASALCDMLLAMEGAKGSAFVMIAIGGLEQLKDSSGVERITPDVLAALRVLLNTDCLVTRHGESALIAYFPKAGQRRDLRQRLESAVGFTRISMAGTPEMNTLRFVSGVVQPREGASYDELTRIAERLCHLHADAPADTVVFLGEGEEDGLGETLLGEDAVGNIRYNPLELNDDMDDGDKNAALVCYEQMMSAESADTAVNGVLRQLGMYYRADRTYILTVAENGKYVTMLNEWYGEGKYSIQQSFSGKPIDAYPVLKRYRKDPIPVLLLSNESAANHTAQNVGRPWRYLVMAVQQRAPEQYFCMENPRVHFDHTALLRRVIPVMAELRERRLSPVKELTPMEKFLNLPNARSYMNTVYTLDSDMYSSVGVLTADIPGLEAFRARNGQEEGARIVVRLSEILTDVFGSALIFHTREAEFVALCTNAGYDGFTANCRRVRHLLEREYPGQYRLGYTWSDGVFSARDLVAKARSIMHYSTSNDMVNRLADTKGMKKRQNPRPVGSIESELWGAGKFTIFVQPKIHMGTGALAGGEALVRIYDRDGRLLPHMRIIEEMERKGNIQELDYFVFDQMLAAMERWQEKGYDVAPMSSNFSRNTLLNSNALASLLAVSSRYPDVPLRKVELEITETAGDLENSTFSELMKQFHEFGFQFSLDDFGSSYSNMSMLANLRFRSVKMDRSMVAGITQNHVSRMMIQDIIRICHECGMLCIAEGVETEDQVEMLLANGCVYAQGYYYDKPLPLEEFENKYYKQRT